MGDVYPNSEKLKQFECMGPWKFRRKVLRNGYIHCETFGCDGMLALIHLVSITLDGNRSWWLIPWCGLQHSACGQYKEPFSGYFESGLDWFNIAQMFKVITSSPWIIQHTLVLVMFMSKKTVGFCEGEIIIFLVTSKTQTVMIWWLEILASKSQNPPEMAAHVQIQKSEKKLAPNPFMPSSKSFEITPSCHNWRYHSELRITKGLYFQAVYFLRKRYNPFQKPYIWGLLPRSLKL